MAQFLTKIDICQPSLGMKSEIVLEAVNAVMPETIGGSADLTGRTTR
jgi:transketolase